MEINKKIITKNPNYQINKIITNNPSINQNLAEECSKIYPNVNNIETRSSNNIKTRPSNNIETRSSNNIKTRSSNNIETRVSNNIETRFSNNIKTRPSNNIETRFSNNMDLYSNQQNPKQIIHSSKSFYHNSCLSSSMDPKKDDPNTNMKNYYEQNLAMSVSVIPDKGYCEPVENENSEKHYPIYPFYQDKYTENKEQSKFENISKIRTKEGNEEHKKDDIHSYNENNKKIFTPNNQHFVFEDQKKLRYSIYGDPMNEVTLEYNLKYN
jgi:hypothetical protein